MLSTRILLINSHLRLLALLEELLLSLLLVGLILSEVLLASDLVNLRLVNAGQIDLLGCGDHVAGVDSSEGDAIDLEWPGDKEDTLGKVLQEDDALAAEATGEEDEHGASSKAWSRGGGSDGFANLECIVSLDASLYRSHRALRSRVIGAGLRAMGIGHPKLTSSNRAQQSLCPWEI